MWRRSVGLAVTSVWLAVGAGIPADAARPLAGRAGNQIHPHRVASVEDVSSLRQEAGWLEQEKQRLAAEEDYASAAVIKKRLEDVEASLQAAGPAAVPAAQKGAESSARQPAAQPAVQPALQRLQSEPVGSLAALSQEELRRGALEQAAAAYLRRDRPVSDADVVPEVHAAFRPGGAGYAMLQRASGLLEGCTDKALQEFKTASEELKQAHDTLLTLHESSFSQVFRGYPPTDDESPQKVQDFLRNMVDATYQLATAGEGQEEELKKQALSDCSKEVEGQLA